ncbi:MAG: hypothetical protein OEV66_04045 [Spirochaetia bacterium]|nr:hypothetical protein [Spirochaetia bacterium]
MNIRKSKKLFFIFSGLAIQTTLIFAFGQTSKAVSVIVKEAKNNLELNFEVKNGYGVQKHGPHEITVYSLDKNYTKSDSPEKTIKNHGKIIYQVKKLKLTGTDASQDRDYLSRVQAVILPVAAAGPIAVKAKIYYCSFADSFCSLEVIHYISGK